MSAAVTKLVRPHRLGSFELQTLVHDLQDVETWTGFQRFPGGVRRACSLHKWVGCSEKSREQFLLEAHLSRWCDHPNILRTIGFERSESHLYYALEVPYSVSLNHLLASAAGPMEPRFAFSVVRGVARAMLFFHELKTPKGTHLGLSYGSLSPEDILISYEGEARVHPIRVRSTPPNKAERYRCEAAEELEIHGQRKDAHLLGLIMLRLLLWPRFQIVQPILGSTRDELVELACERIDPKWRAEVYRSLIWCLGALDTEEPQTGLSIDVLLERLEQLPGGRAVLKQALEHGMTTLHPKVHEPHTEFDPGCRAVANR